MKRQTEGKVGKEEENELEWKTLKFEIKKVFHGNREWGSMQNLVLLLKKKIEGSEHKFLVKKKRTLGYLMIKKATITEKKEARRLSREVSLQNSFPVQKNDSPLTFSLLAQ